MTQRNPFVLALYGLSALLGLAALIIQRVGVSKAWLSGGMDSDSGDFLGIVYDPTILLRFNVVALVLLVLCIVILSATLVFQAARWKPAGS